MSTKDILVVDDEQLVEYVIQQRFRKEIEEEKYRFTFASNGIEALEKFQPERSFDMVLTDLNMPKMNGLTLLKKLKGINEEIKTVVISAYGSLENTKAATDLGICDFLVKPIYLQDLEKVLKTQLYGQVLKYGHLPRTDYEVIEKFRNHPKKLPLEEAVRLYYLQKVSGFSIEDAFTETLRLFAKPQEAFSFSKN